MYRGDLGLERRDFAFEIVLGAFHGEQQGLCAVVVPRVGGGERGAEKPVEMGVDLEGYLVAVFIFVLGGGGGGVVVVVIIGAVVVVVVIDRLRAGAFALSRSCC